MIAELCGYAERFVFDLLRQAYLFFGGGGGRCYILYLQVSQRQRFPCTTCEKSYCQKGILYEDLYTLHTDYFTSKKAAFEHSAAGLSVNFKLLPALIPFAS